MLLIITPALVHCSSDLGRGSEMQLVSIFSPDYIMVVRFWDHLELYVSRGFLRCLKLIYMVQLEWKYVFLFLFLFLLFLVTDFDELYPVLKELRVVRRSTCWIV